VSKKQLATKAAPSPTPPMETVPEVKARGALMPTINAASVIQSYQRNIMGSDVDLPAMIDRLDDTIMAVRNGDLSRLEAMLLGQATALQTMFSSLAIRAAKQEQLRHIEGLMALALKAQAQSRATISALVDLKYPRQATFVKQANIANGPQQVNNGEGARPAAKRPRVRAHEANSKGVQTELLEVSDGQRLDTRAASTASRTDPHLAPVAKVHRTPQRGRQGEGGA
jgi:hypothetical protein